MQKGKNRKIRPGPTENQKKTSQKELAGTHGAHRDPFKNAKIAKRIEKTPDGRNKVYQKRGDVLRQGAVRISIASLKFKRRKVMQGGESSSLESGGPRPLSQKGRGRCRPT